MIPTSLQADGIAKTIALSREAISLRMQSAAGRLSRPVNYYYGQPSADNLPNEALSIFLFLNGVTPDVQGSTHQAPAYIGQWQINIILRDEGYNDYGFDPSEGESILGEVLESLLSDLDDVSLDSAVEFIDDPRVTPFQGQYGGDQLIYGYTVDISAHHPLAPIRCPP